VPATRAQVETIVRLCAGVCRYHRWDVAEVHSRIVGHDAQAIWTREQTQSAGISDAKGRLLWGKLGRKVDPTGQRRDGKKILDVTEVRVRVRAQLALEPVAEMCHAVA
jgi:hypothetical protein